MKTYRAALRAALATTVALACAGCISYRSERDIVYSDLPSEQLVRQVVPGQTDTTWLTANLGEPTAITRKQNGSIWEYHRLTESATKMRALPLFAVSFRNQKRVKYSFLMENGLVARFWESSE